jgi:hypothetical protein
VTWGMGLGQQDRPVRVASDFQRRGFVAGYRAGGISR